MSHREVKVTNKGGKTGTQAVWTQSPNPCELQPPFYKHQHHLCPWLYLGGTLEAHWGFLGPPWILVSGHIGQQKPLHSQWGNQGRAEGTGESRSRQDDQRSAVGGRGPSSLHLTEDIINKLDCWHHPQIWRVVGTGRGGDRTNEQMLLENRNWSL